MAGKLTAVGSECYVGSADLSGDIGAVSNMDAMLAALTVTPINAGAPVLIPGRKDGAMGFMSFYNIDAGQEHAIFSAVPRTDVMCTVAIGTPALGSPAASIIAKQMNYAGTIGDDGSLGFQINMQGSGFGLEWGELLTTGKQSFATGTVAGTAIDLGSASTAFGCAVYLHVFSVASGTAVFKVQDSDTNIDADFDDLSGMTFTGATGPTTQRLQMAAGSTVRQYVRVVGTGTHGAAVVAANFVRYTEAGPI